MPYQASHFNSSSYRFLFLHLLPLESVSTSFLM